MKLSSLNAQTLKTSTESCQLKLITNGQVDVGGVTIGRTTEGVSMFKGSVASLNCLLREWEIAARDGVEVSVNLRLTHDFAPVGVAIFTTV